mgnify:FL=1|jgi:hypothetical protein|tara:strand:+ start:911 stop:1129 length:219 start_codon:yes stop_codon:yes gene_type:complete
MDNETYLKEMAKHVQRNNTPPKDNNLNQKKIQIKTFKVEGEYERLMASIDISSLELYRQMMADRYGNHNEEE